MKRARVTNRSREVALRPPGMKPGVMTKAINRSLAETAPLQLRCGIALGMWAMFATTFPKQFRAPKYLLMLTEQLVEEIGRCAKGEVRTCRECGCTDGRACEGGCWWVEQDLCSKCASHPQLTKVATSHALRLQRDARDREAVERSVRRQKYRRELVAGDNAGRAKR